MLGYDHIKVKYMRKFRKHIATDVINNDGYVKLNTQQMVELADMFTEIYKDGKEKGRELAKISIKRRINNLLKEL